MPNKIIIYYSLEGSTRLMAETMARAIGADILELKPLKEINPNGFLKYFWGGRQVIFKEKPKLEIFAKNPLDYDIIIIGTPVWAFTFAPPLRSFFKRVKLRDKKIGIFCCHEGNFGKTLENLAKELAGNTIIGQADFLNIKKDQEKNIKKAKDWALKIKQQSFR
ncbi:MAG: NAD(P)H-dependent oxidoreductase [Patescibacteria group bacterium]|nr:NAD(P)H-dependent oxidoreductase [Patescibacteria group bacterium]